LRKSYFIDFIEAIREYNIVVTTLMFNPKERLEQIRKSKTQKE